MGTDQIFGTDKLGKRPEFMLLHNLLGVRSVTGQLGDRVIGKVASHLKSFNIPSSQYSFQGQDGDSFYSLVAEKGEGKRAVNIVYT